MKTAITATTVDGQFVIRLDEARLMFVMKDELLELRDLINEKFPPEIKRGEFERLRSWTIRPR